MADNVNHPAHYQSRKGIETIDIIEACVEDLTGMDAVCTGNVIKYISRWKKKNGLEDLKKARWYLNKLIDSRTSTTETINSTEMMEKYHVHPKFYDSGNKIHVTAPSYKKENENAETKDI